MGEEVADFRLTYPGWECAVGATLAEAYAQAIVLEPALSDDMEHSCVLWTREPLRVRLGEEGTLYTSELGTLVPRGPAAADVPAGFIGRWRWDRPYAGMDFEITIRAGKPGDEVLDLHHFPTDRFGFDECVATGTLLKAFPMEIELRPAPKQDTELDCENLGWTTDFHLELDGDRLQMPRIGTLVRA